MKNDKMLPQIDGESGLLEKFKRVFKKSFEKKQEQNYEQILSDILTYGVHIPKDTILTHSGFGYGVRVWDKYRYFESTVAQYMSPYMITQNTRLRNSVHYNLCGELAVMASTGADISDGLNKFATLSGGTDIINNNKTTSAYILANFITALSFIKYDVPEIPRNSIAIKEYETFDIALNSGDIIIALVNIDISREGNLRGMNESSRKVAHWVWVQKVFMIEDRKFVRVYNPYMNREEIYSYERFLSSYAQTYGNTSTYLSVYAKRIP